MLTDSFKNATAAADRAGAESILHLQRHRLTGLVEAGWAYASVHNSGCSLQEFGMQHMLKAISCAALLALLVWQCPVLQLAAVTV